jgi:hypothetical protein
MNFNTKRKVENGIFTTQVVFDSYGVTAEGSEMSEAQEKALFNDLGNPKINLSDIVFSGKYKVDADTRVVAAEDTDVDADEVKFVMNNKPLTLAEGFVAEYTVDSDSFQRSAYENNKSLTTPQLMAEARCVLFEDKVNEAIVAAVTKVKNQRTKFETAEVPTLTV